MTDHDEPGAGLDEEGPESMGPLAAPRPDTGREGTVLAPGGQKDTTGPDLDEEPDDRDS